jgi:hypothetical protein
MRKVEVGLVVVAVIAVLAMAGCRDSAGETTETTEVPAATETTVAQAPSTATSATSAPSPETTAALPGSGGDWTTIATLSSSDEPWQDMDGLYISEPFSVSGEAQLVLDMPDAEELDGVIIAIIPPDKTSDFASLIDAVQSGVVVTIPAVKPVRAVTGLDGEYVLVNSVPASKPWSVELQSRP